MRKCFLFNQDGTVCQTPVHGTSICDEHQKQLDSGDLEVIAKHARHELTALVCGSGPYYKQPTGKPLRKVGKNAGKIADALEYALRKKDLIESACDTEDVFTLDELEANAKEVK